jgi:hypothetical protein
MQAIGEKLNIPVRNAKLFPFGEPAAAEEKDEAAAGGMLEEVQVRLQRILCHVVFSAPCDLM